MEFFIAEIMVPFCNVSELISIFLLDKTWTLFP